MYVFPLSQTDNSVCVASHLIVDILPVHRWQRCRPNFEVVLPEIWNLDLRVGTNRFGIVVLLVVLRGLLATRILDVPGSVLLGL